MIGAAIAIVGSGEMNTVSQLAYIMNSSAEGKDMKTLGIDGYLDWLEQFETMEFIVHAMDIIMLYMNNRATTSTPKKRRPTDREVNTALYLLRAKQIGLSLAEMEELDEGIIFDMIVESANDNESDSYHELATQADFDKF